MADFAEVRDKAWHLVVVLLRLGRPASPEELAERCLLFRASPEFVVFLCTIQDSPLFLTAERMVSVSVSVFSAVREYVSRGAAAMSRRVKPTLPSRYWEDHVLTYARKRKRSEDVFVPFSNGKRPVLCLENVEAGSGDVLKFSSTDNTMNNSFKEYADAPLDKNGDVYVASANVSMMEDATRIFTQEGELSPRFVDLRQFTNVAPQIIESVEPQAIELRHTDTMSRLLHWELFEFKSSNEINFADVIGSQRRRLIDPDLQLTLSSHSLEMSPCREEKSMVRQFICGTPQTECANELRSSRVDYLEAGSDVCKTPADGELANLNICYCKEIDFLGTASRKDLEGNNHVTVLAPMGELHETELALSISNQNSITEPSMLPQASEKLDSVVQTIAQPLSAQQFLKTPLDRFECKSMDMDGSGLYRNDQVADSVKPLAPLNRHKAKRSRSHNVPNKEEKVCHSSKVIKNVETKNLPNFESFIVVEEEGSGGYGTVYKARRKKDGNIFAIKCPHANATFRHVSNELKMLQRFGGKNFVIKYEDSFKSGNSDCLVLEHVEHDRPEVLKKEIKVSELLWYGYCMFKALASLHKLEIAHRDVKPGNFLFSRKLNTGYLIDFNLALDLRQKYCSTRKLKAITNCISIRNHDSVSIASPYAEKAKSDLHCRSPEATKGLKPTLEKTTKRRVDVSHLKSRDKMRQRNACRSQGGEASGVTSAKTPSADKYLLHIPSTARKEIVSLAQEAIKRPNHQEITTPVFQRKRVAAPLRKAENTIHYLSPMPLRAISITGAGMLINKGKGKHRKEGPCVGTKGFRAPEVLFKSLHQGPKVDIWSAGATLLCLILGRAPFVGEPEQNIKEIAKLRGSEDLWETAKLHNSECSFPEELLDIQWLPSMDLRAWCEKYTKRPEFLEQIPNSLFDLVDKCLTVNPRMRINAEDALRHEFFVPCREVLRKQRLVRLGKSDAGIQPLDHLSSQMI